jgi:hypothetical protein
VRERERERERESSSEHVAKRISSAFVVLGSDAPNNPMVRGPFELGYSSRADIAATEEEAILET